MRLDLLLLSPASATRPPRGSGGDRQLTEKEMSKLIDSQLVLLSAAAQREDRMLAPPGHLKGPAAMKVLKPLLRSRFIEEVPAKNGYPIYRRDPDDGPIALRVTDKGLSVIGVEPQGPTTSPETAKEAALKKGSRKSEPQKQKPAAKPKSALAADSGGPARHEASSPDRDASDQARRQYRRHR
jgi:hypothetical protein